MFILTIDSDDQQAIAAALRELANDVAKHDNCTGSTSNGESFEFAVLANQKWMMFAEMLSFDENDKLRKYG